MADFFQSGNHMSNLFNGYQEVGVATNISNAKSSLVLDPSHQPSLATVTYIKTLNYIYNFLNVLSASLLNCTLSFNI